MIAPSDFPRNKKVLFCILNWGLGHATRSSVVIQQLLNHQNEVVIASDGMALDLLNDKFPSLEKIQLTPYNVTYPYESVMINFLANALNIYRAVESENKLIQSIDKVQNYDLLISDNRPGCRLKNKSNYFITHQLNPFHKNKLYAKFFYYLNAHFIKKFTKVWIPDYDDFRLSGQLSLDKENVFLKEFIGPLSIYENNHSSRNETTILLSGPEPQRTILENNLLEILEKHIKDSTTKINFVRGTSKPLSKNIFEDKVTFYDLCNMEELNHILNKSEKVLSRTGYTTIMDLDRLDIKTALLIPTPGQTEQEYLAEWHSQRWSMTSQNESEKIIEFLRK